MDKSYLLRRNTTGYQFLPHIVVDIESTVIFRSRKVAEHKLCRFGIGVFLPDTVHIIHAGVDLAVFKVWQHRVDKPLVKCQLAPIICDFQHIVDIRLYKSVTDFLGSLCEGSNHFRLDFARSDLDIAVVDLWHGELQHISGLNIG